MTTSIQPGLLDDYAQYFNVQQDFSVNVMPLAGDQTLPTAAEFPDHLPELFKLAGDMLVIDQAQLRDLNMSERSAKLIAQILNQQAQRLSMVLTYLLRHEDDPAYRQNGISYGGGGFTYQPAIVETSKETGKDTAKKAATLALGDYVQVKLFLADDYAAVFAYGQVIDIQSPNGDKQPVYTIAFVHIREEDQELLVRASLHAQTRQLKQRSDERKLHQNKLTDETDNDT